MDDVSVRQRAIFKIVTAVLLLRCMMKLSQESEFTNLSMYSKSIARTSGENFIAQCLSMRCF